MFDNFKTDQLKVEIKEGAFGAIEFNIIGLIDTYNSNAFFNKIYGIIKDGYNKFIFNCDRLTYMSSTGIGAMAQLLKEIKNTKEEGFLYLVAVSPSVYDVFSLLGFTSFFNFKDSIEDVYKTFDKSFEKKKDIFPLIIACPVCHKKLRASKGGRYRCPSCKHIIKINNEAKITV